MSVVARLVRPFLAAPGVVEQLAADFLLPMPTMCAYLSLAHIGRPLRVVCVILRARGRVGELTPPSVLAFTEYEPVASLKNAKAHGWELVPGLPQPPVAR